jgi:hypothetical protein
MEIRGNTPATEGDGAHSASRESVLPKPAKPTVATAAAAVPERDESKTAAQQHTTQQVVETVAVSVGVEKGMVLMALTPTEAAFIERSRIQASRGPLSKRMPRDWTTPLALLVPLAAALVTNISDRAVHAGFVVATVIAAIWLILAVVTRVVDRIKHGKGSSSVLR